MNQKVYQRLHLLFSFLLLFAVAPQVMAQDEPKCSLSWGIVGSKRIGFSHKGGNYFTALNGTPKFREPGEPGEPGPNRWVYVSVGLWGGDWLSLGDPFSGGKRSKGYWTNVPESINIWCEPNLTSSPREWTIGADAPNVSAVALTVVQAPFPTTYAPERIGTGLWDGEEFEFEVRYRNMFGGGLGGTPSWIHIKKISEVTSEWDRDVRYVATIEPNWGPSDREAIIPVVEVTPGFVNLGKKKNIVVRQRARAPLSVVPNPISFGPTGGKVNVSVRGGNFIAEVEESATWLAVTPTWLTSARIDALSNSGVERSAIITFSAEGALPVDVRVTQSAGRSAPGRAAASWLVSKLPGVSSEYQTFMLSDPDEDGVLNLLEYATGSDPAVPGPFSMIAVDLDSPGQSKELKVKVRGDDPELNFTLLYGSNLSQMREASLNFDGSTRTWTTPSSDITILSAVDLGGGIWQLGVQVADATNQLFARMRVGFNEQ